MRRGRRKHFVPQGNAKIQSSQEWQKLKLKVDTNRTVAAILQHEYDHLLGALFVDKVEGKIWDSQEFLDSGIDNSFPPGSWDFVKE